MDHSVDDGSNGGVEGLNDIASGANVDEAKNAKDSGGLLVDVPTGECACNLQRIFIINFLYLKFGISAFQHIEKDSDAEEIGIKRSGETLENCECGWLL